MSYYPYFRGKQYELICIRENAELIAGQRFIPILEPVREQARGLERAMTALKDANAGFLVVANPSVGAHTEELGNEVGAAISAAMVGYSSAGWLFQVRSPADIESLNDWIDDNSLPSIFHSGYTDGKVLAAIIAETGSVPAHHIFASNCSRAYRRQFNSENRILIADGFKKQKNADYLDNELFSELNISYEDQDMTGFGDYLIVGNEYSESGGPAYAVAIHITYLDPDNDNGIYVRHFVSDDNDSPTDPAGKFRQAVAKLAIAVLADDSKIKRTTALEEFILLYRSGHFPGLGYVKKLSMQHHLELLADI